MAVGCSWLQYSVLHVGYCRCAAAALQLVGTPPVHCEYATAARWANVLLNTGFLLVLNLNLNE